MGQQLSRAAWEIHRPELRRLYIEQKMKLQDIIHHMERSHSFHARYATSKADDSRCRLTFGMMNSIYQYEEAFRTWGFRKNLNKDDYQYIDHRTKKRKAEDEGLEIQRESAVYLNDQRIPPKRIKKALSNLSRPTLPRPANSRLYAMSPPTGSSPNVCYFLVIEHILKFYEAPSPDTPPGLIVRTPHTPHTPATPGNGRPSPAPGNHPGFKIRLDNLPWFQFENLIKTYGKAAAMTVNSMAINAL